MPAQRNQRPRQVVTTSHTNPAAVTVILPSPDPYPSDGPGVNYLVTCDLVADVDAYTQGIIDYQTLIMHKEIKLGESKDFEQHQHRYAQCQHLSDEKNGDIVQKLRMLWMLGRTGIQGLSQELDGLLCVVVSGSNSTNKIAETPNIVRVVRGIADKRFSLVKQSEGLRIFYTLAMKTHRLGTKSTSQMAQRNSAVRMRDRSQFGRRSLQFDNLINVLLIPSPLEP
ncbi:hypothetical protein DFH08DRAFT_827852 [Mycena albidolilacea]|uniref:Uncharacterized protein n=1 Tax=Mycena albidolilacea TaxID=1033008 RepID=A0AAD6YY48_9AGAR|nr:hypothetical protein DFH08DRAFT_827852 [Mycena albidolilacea]